jgi:hypothetical protein
LNAATTLSPSRRRDRQPSSTIDPLVATIPRRTAGIFDFIESVGTPEARAAGEGRRLDALLEPRTRQRILRVAEAEAAAYVVSPANATAIGYEPVAVGAVVVQPGPPLRRKQL